MSCYALKTCKLDNPEEKQERASEEGAGSSSRKLEIALGEEAGRRKEEFAYRYNYDTKGCTYSKYRLYVQVSRVFVISQPDPYTVQYIELVLRTDYSGPIIIPENSITN